MNHTPRQARHRRLSAQLMIGAMLVQTVAPAFATVSQLPGLYTTPPDANVMFTLDDSLSMVSDAIPDFINDQVGMPNADANSQASDALNGQAGQQRARFPGMWRTNTLYWGVTYYRSDNAIARYLRSSAGNPLYYNPTVTYKPWPLATDETQTHANANPAAVNIDPTDPFNTAVTRNLTVRVNATGTAADGDNQANNFWPATYYVYTGTTPLPNANPSTTLNVAGNFTKYVVTGRATDLTTYNRASTRTDCTGAVGAGGCSRVQELQNFANWLQYYRSRMLMAKGGVAAAFAQQQSNLRVGFGSINSTGTVRQGVATFSGTRRATFYTDLYAIPPSGGGTQLRRAMDEVGAYFQRADVGNPWAANPASNQIGTEYSCRKSFHILSTDGYWNGAAAGGTRNDNNDNYSGNTPKKPDGTEYAYSDTATGADPLIGRFNINPFTDTRSATLADVAAYYWKTDLRGNLANDVPSSLRDPAFWQHLSTYTVGLGVAGSGTVTVGGSATVPAGLATTVPSLTPYIGRPWLESQVVRDYLVDRKVAVDWPAVAQDTAQTGDDLVHASMNGRGRYYAASDPTALTNGLAAALAEAGDNPGSMANIATESPQVSVDTEVYQATYNPARWSGRLYAFRQTASGAVSSSPSSAIWEASNKMPAPQNRNIYTWDPGANLGRAFTWANLTTAQKTALNDNSDVLDFLRGSDVKELANGGTFRDRSRYAIDSVKGGVLGDIVNGSPIKGPSAGGGYHRMATSVPGQSSYATYRAAGNTALDNMRDTLFVAANDGMLHAFNRHDGVERFAYVPNSVYSVPVTTALTENKLAMLSSPAYSHRFTVDGPPQIGDAFIGSGAVAAAWKTVLLGSTGAGARSVFAMDITNPAVGNSSFGTSKLMWEFSQTNSTDMGYVLSYPHIARMRDGTWVAIFGNGYDSPNGQATLFVLNLQTGAVLWKQAVGPVGGNGLSQPNFTVNDKREVTGIYAGDLLGNLWKFDVDSDDPTKWKVAFGAAPNYTPLYAPTAATTGRQPITVMPEITYHPNGGVLLSFGTGKLFEVEDTGLTTPTNKNMYTQSIFGVWDKPGETTGFTGSSTLVQQGTNTTLAAAANTALTGTTAYTIDWTTKRGWFLNLASGGERVNVNPQQAESTLLVVANKPDIDPCKTGGSSRLFALDPITGGAPVFGVFDSDNSGRIDKADRGYNVRAITFAVLSLPTLQTKKTVADQITTEPAGTRGQTAARQGGVEDLPRSQQDCAKWLLAGGSDTSIAGFDISLCNNNKPRISWRQLK